MYYKIENKESDVYKKLKDLRDSENQIRLDNIKSIEDKTNNKFTSFIGYSGQQNFRRVTQYVGFKFEDTANICLKTWKLDKDNEGVYLPNLRTKSGREMSEFLCNGLKGSSIRRVEKILNMPHYNRFIFPFIELLENEVIILFLDDKFDPTDENIIEITKTEFNKLNS